MSDQTEFEALVERVDWLEKEVASAQKREKTTRDLIDLLKQRLDGHESTLGTIDELFEDLL